MLDIDLHLITPLQVGDLITETQMSWPLTQEDQRAGDDQKKNSDWGIR
jgi:hypothetical protein